MSVARLSDGIPFFITFWRECIQDSGIVLIIVILVSDESSVGTGGTLDISVDIRFPNV